MNVSFENLKIGHEYDRNILAEIWGYKGHQAISRGVITPAGTNKIILFVTKEKQSSSTQYVDYIKDNNLFWEGENKHGSDIRIKNSSNNDDEIHLFYREIHHTPFIYYGEIFLDQSELFSDKPSKFIFSVMYRH